jgi:hypothetical protein
MVQEVGKVAAFGEGEEVRPGTIVAEVRWTMDFALHLRLLVTTVEDKSKTLHQKLLSET